MDVLCPTHQAKYQFAQKLKPHKRLELNTVASFLTQFPIVDKASGELIFQRGGFGGCDADLLVIDEASMVSEYEMSELLNAKDYVLVIFLGDYEQLRPVMKKQGDLYKQLTTFVLKEQQRNAGPILKMCTRLRKELFYPKKTIEKSNGKIIVHNQEREFLSSFLYQLKHAKRKYDICYLAYRNVRVERVRQRVHKMLYGNKSFVRGQYLRLDGKSIAGNNGSLVRVLKVEAKEDRVIGEFKCVVFTIKLRNLDTKLDYHVEMVGPKTQIKLKEHLQQLYERSAKAFRKNHAVWQECQDMIKEIRAVCLYSNPNVRTVHKAQGSSIPVVYVDTLDVSTGHDRKRLMYVGCSRAIDEIHTIRIPDK